MLIRKYLLAFGLGVLICNPHFLGGTRARVPQAQAGETCPGAPQERYRVSVRIETPSPMVNHNLNRAELTWMTAHGVSTPQLTTLIRRPAQCPLWVISGHKRQ